MNQLIHQAPLPFAVMVLNDRRRTYRLWTEELELSPSPLTKISPCTDLPRKKVTDSGRGITSI